MFFVILMAIKLFSPERFCTYACSESEGFGTRKSKITSGVEFLETAPKFRKKLNF